jgi:tRNA-(ms[2]io[6]A)-hydroxylase
MLKLASRTPPAWAEAALARLDEILLDHAHCEKKAAGMAVTLLFQYPEQAALQAPLSALAREELGHFEAVLAELRRREIPFGRQRPASYAGRLRAVVREGEPARLVDTLLCSALIEARSCERLGLLADALAARGDAPGLARLYAQLRSAEARHHRIYTDLACEVVPASEVRARLAELARHEAAALAAAADGGARLHT